MQHCEGKGLRKGGLERGAVSRSHQAVFDQEFCCTRCQWLVRLSSMACCVLPPVNHDFTGKLDEVAEYYERKGLCQGEECSQLRVQVSAAAMSALGFKPP